MNESNRTILWRQLGAAIAMLENAIVACPEALWRDRVRRPEYWYVAFHALFWLDFHLSESPDSFAPPAPFTLVEMDPAGVLPERVYTKNELLAYLEHGRAKARARIDALTDAADARRFRFGWMDFTVTEVLLYTMRHVQHHTAQLNLILRQERDAAPGWVRRA